MNTTLLGREGEARAAEYLRKKRYRLLASGYRSRYGEIDLIAQTGGTVVFVEVKLRKSDRFGRACEAVNLQKQEKIRKTALQWMAQLGHEVEARFDVIEIYSDTGQLVHIQNAF